jgi:hypothetical protein
MAESWALLVLAIICLPLKGSFGFVVVTDSFHSAASRRNPRRLTTTRGLFVIASAALKRRGDHSVTIGRKYTHLRASDVEFMVNATDSVLGWETDVDGDFDESSLEVLDDPSSAQTDNDEEDQDNALMEEYSSWSAALEQALEGMERKRNALMSELEKAKNVEQLSHRAQLIISNLYLFTDSSVKSVLVEDWQNGGKEVVLKLDPQYESAPSEADALFAQVRKLKRGSQVISDLLVEVEQALVILQDARTDLGDLYRSGITGVVGEERFRFIQDRLRLSSGKTKFGAPSKSPQTSWKKPNPNKKKSVLEACVRKLKSPSGCVVWVGRNRRGNEYLSFQVARGQDIWMHARGCPGAHVVLQHRRGSPKPIQEDFDFCANLAVFYSDARNERKASVSAAEPKHILKPRGAPLGAVKLREELFVLTGRPEDVPEELKSARDQSGTTDEFRSKEKAKRRKRTKDAAKQDQERRRAELRANRRRRRQSTTDESDAEQCF